MPLSASTSGACSSSLKNCKAAGFQSAGRGELLTHSLCILRTVIHSHPEVREAYGDE